MLVVGVDPVTGAGDAAGAGAGAGSGVWAGAAAGAGSAVAGAVSVDAGSLSVDAGSLGVLGVSVVTGCSSGEAAGGSDVGCSSGEEAGGSVTGGGVSAGTAVGSSCTAPGAVAACGDSPSAASAGSCALAVPARTDRTTQIASARRLPATSRGSHLDAMGSPSAAAEPGSADRTGAGCSSRLRAGATAVTGKTFGGRPLGVNRWGTDRAMSGVEITHGHRPRTETVTGRAQPERHPVQSRSCSAGHVLTTRCTGTPHSSARSQPLPCQSS